MRPGAIGAGIGGMGGLSSGAYATYIDPCANAQFLQRFPEQCADYLFGAWGANNPEVATFLTALIASAMGFIVGEGIRWLFPSS
jgi:hypothetical protein